MTQITQPSSSYLILLLLLPTPACNTHDKYETPPIPMERADSSNPAGPGAEATPHGLPRSDAASTDERASAEIENRQPNCEWREKPKDEVFVDGQEEPIVPHHCYSPRYNIMVYKNVSLTQGRIEWVQPPKMKGGKSKSHPGIENEHKAAILYATYVCNHNFKGNWGEANKAALVVNKAAKNKMDKAVPRGKIIGRGYGELQPREPSQRNAAMPKPVPESNIQSSLPTSRAPKVGCSAPKGSAKGGGSRGGSTRGGSLGEQTVAQSKQVERAKSDRDKALARVRELEALLVQKDTAINEVHGKWATAWRLQTKNLRVVLRMADLDDQELKKELQPIQPPYIS